MSLSHHSAITAAQASQSVSSDESLIRTDAGQRLYELIEREQLPGDVRSTLAGALTGDLTRQALLFQAMVDTWPRLSKALTEVGQKVRNAPWKVAPYSKRGEEPDKVSQERADFIEDCFWVTSPEARRNEKSGDGLIKELVWGYYAGHHVVEVLWERDGAGVLKPRAYKAVPPRFYGYPAESTQEDVLMFDPDGGMSGYRYEDFPKHHFLIAMNGAHPGHPTVSAPLRALTGYWLAANFGLKWLLQFAQLYGVPFRWAEYSDESVKGKVCNMLESIGSSGWGAFPKGTTLHFEEARKSAEQIPQKMLIEMADKQAEIFILGQSLTSDVGDSGSRALGDVHNDVRFDVIEGVSDFVGDVLNRQLLPSMSELNYGDRESLPEFKATFERPKDEKGMAERDAVLLKAGVKMPREWFYDRHGVPVPAGDEEVVGGELEPDGGLGKSERVESRAAGDDEEVSLDGLLDSVLEGLTGVSAEWLAPVRPEFERLVGLFEKGEASDADLIEVLDSANDALPELFELLDTDALQTAFEEAIGSAVAGGSAERYVKEDK